MELIALLLFVLVIASMMRANTRLIEQPGSTPPVTATTSPATN